jgi:hypothetical protein
MIMATNDHGAFVTHRWPQWQGQTGHLTPATGCEFPDGVIDGRRTYSATAEEPAGIIPLDACGVQGVW